MESYGGLTISSGIASRAAENRKQCIYVFYHACNEVSQTIVVLDQEQELDGKRVSVFMIDAHYTPKKSSSTSGNAPRKQRIVSLLDLNCFTFRGGFRMKIEEMVQVLVMKPYLLPDLKGAKVVESLFRVKENALL